MEVMRSLYMDKRGVIGCEGGGSFCTGSYLAAVNLYQAMHATHTLQSGHEIRNTLQHPQVGHLYISRIWDVEKFHSFEVRRFFKMHKLWHFGQYI